MLMHFKQGQTQRLRTSSELIADFRTYLGSKNVNLPSTIQPSDLTNVATAMGLRVTRGTTNPAALAAVIRHSPVAIFGQYSNVPGGGPQHATVAYKLAGNLKSTMDLYIHGFDPQVSQSEGTPYKKDFMSFHDTVTPNLSVCRQI